MSLNKNIFANYTGVVVTTLLIFLVVPLYLRWLGPDAYGLVGISTLIQGWIMLLNAGLAPVAGRQAAQAHGGFARWQQTGRLLRTIDWLLFGLSLPIVFSVFYFRQWLAEHWLEKNNLGTETIALSLVLLALTTLIRLATSMSRGIIANLEEQVWLNINLIIFSVLRFAVSLPLVYCWSSINVLFVWWLVIAMLEYVSIQRKISLSIPVHIPFFIFDTVELKKHGRMTITLAATGGIWIIVTNLDKLLLSGMLPLAEYGYFSIAALLAGGVPILAQPISQAFQPRLTKAYVTGGMNAVCSEFRQCTHRTILFVFPVGAVLFALPETVLTLWTRDPLVAENAANILRGYVVGSTFLAAGSLLHGVQVAIGNVRWHLWGNLIFATVLFPTLPWVAVHYGAEGAGWLWAGFNFLLFIVWNGFLLKKLVRPLFPQWLLIDTLLPMLISFVIALIANYGVSYFFVNEIGSLMFMMIFIIFLSLFIFSVLWFFFRSRE